MRQHLNEQRGLYKTNVVGFVSHKTKKYCEHGNIISGTGTNLRSIFFIEENEKTIRAGLISNGNWPQSTR